MDDKNTKELTELSDKKEKEEEKEAYVSKNGFIISPIRRGFTEISNLYDLVYGKYAEDAFVCGGYVRYCCSNQTKPHPASDVDIYCKNKDVFENLKKDLLKDLNIKHENDISLLFENPIDKNNPYAFCPSIQIIKPNRIGKIVANFFASIEEILNNFDFTIIRGAIISKTEALVDADFEHDDEKKILRIKNIHCPISSCMRMMKYRAKGFFTPPTEIMRLFIDWQMRDKEYKNKLNEYLITANKGHGLNREEVDELEALMRVD